MRAIHRMKTLTCTRANIVWSFRSSELEVRYAEAIQNNSVADGQVGFVVGEMGGE
jgi:hypothetical protein